MRESKYRLDIKLSILYSLVSKVITVLNSIVLLPLTLISVGVENFATFNIAVAMVAWVFVFSGGFSPLLVKTFSNSVDSKDRAKAFQLSVISTLIIVLVVALLFLTFFFNANSTSFIRIHAELVFLVLSLAVLNMIITLFSAIRQGENNQYINNKISTIANFCSLFFMFLFYYLNRTSLLELAVITFGFNIICNLFYLKPLIKKHVYIFEKVNLEKKELKVFFLASLYFLIIQISVYLNQQISLLMAAEYLDDVNVSQLTFIFRFFLVLGGLITMLYMPLWPSISNALSAGNMNWIRESSKKLTLLLSFYGIVVFLFTSILGEKIFETWSGNTLFLSTDLTVGIGFYFLLICLYQTNVIILTGLGKIAQLAYTSLAENVIFIVAIYLFKEILSLEIIIFSMIAVKMFIGIPMSYCLRLLFLNRGHNE